MVSPPSISWTQGQQSPPFTKIKWDSLPSVKIPLKPWTGKPSVGVAGSPLEVSGTAFVDIEIAGEHFTTQVVMASALTIEAILGGDFERQPVHPGDWTTAKVWQPRDCDCNGYVL